MFAAQAALELNWAQLSGVESSTKYLKSNTTIIHVSVIGLSIHDEKIIFFSQIYTLQQFARKLEKVFLKPVLILCEIRLMT